MLRKLSQLAAIFTGHHARKGVDEEQHGTHRLLQIRDFSADRRSVSFDHMVLVSPGKIRPEMCLQPGDVVFLAKGVHKFAYALAEVPEQTLASGYFFVLRSSHDILPAYLAWLLRQERAQRYYQQFGTSGAHMPVVSREVLGNLEVPVPDLRSQRMIIEMDEVTRYQQSLLAQLSEKKRLLATAACLRLAEQTLTSADSPNS